MKLPDLLSMCARNLTRRKFRTFLTVFGVVVGTSFIVLMISLGIAVSENSRAQLESRGDLTIIQIYNYGNTETPLTDEALAAIGRLPGVSAVTTVVQLGNAFESWGEIYAGRRDRYATGYWSAVAMIPAGLEEWGFKLTAGSWLPAQSESSQDVTKRVVPVLMGEFFAYDFRDTRKRQNDMVDRWSVPDGEPLPDPFFDPYETPLVLEIQPSAQNAKPLRIELQVVGTLGENYQMDFYDAGCLMALDDLRAIKEAFNEANNIRPDRDAVEGYDNAHVKCASIDDVAAVEELIHTMGFTDTWSMEEQRQEMQAYAGRLQLILGIIGGVALFISALSIMNTMIMSVYERTREIGVMKVLGCVLGDIRAVFLIEAGLIGLLGGLIGDTLSSLASYLFNRYGGSLGDILGGGGGGYYRGGEEVVQRLSVIPPWLLLLGLVFATCVGLVSGILPAMRAVKISALEAIRTE